MMMGLKPLFIGLVLGCGGMYFAHQYHVLNSSDGIVIVPRAQSTSIANVYTDVRGWTASQWAEEPLLSAALMKAGREELMTQETASHILDEKNSSFDISGLSTPEQQNQQAQTPEIIFRRSSDSQRIPSTPQSPKRDSLLERLSRQLKRPASSNGLKQRPLIRETTSLSKPKPVIQSVSLPTTQTQGDVPSEALSGSPTNRHASSDMRIAAIKADSSLLPKPAVSAPLTEEAFAGVTRSVASHVISMVDTNQDQAAGRTSKASQDEDTLSNSGEHERRSAAPTNHYPIDSSYLAQKIPASLIKDFQALEPR